MWRGSTTMRQDCGWFYFLCFSLKLLLFHVQLWQTDGVGLNWSSVSTEQERNEKIIFLSFELFSFFYVKVNMWKSNRYTFRGIFFHLYIFNNTSLFPPNISLKVSPELIQDSLDQRSFVESAANHSNQLTWRPGNPFISGSWSPVPLGSWPRRTETVLITASEFRPRRCHPAVHSLSLTLLHHSQRSRQRQTAMLLTLLVRDSFAAACG